MQLPWRDVTLGSSTISTSITPAEGQSLRYLATDKRVLEIGSAYGYSAVRMAASAKSVLAVDPHTGHNSLAAMQANLVRYDRHERVSILLATSQQALPMLWAVGAQFDLIFIDGDHSAEAVYHDVRYAQGMFSNGGVLVCHDYGEESCPGVKVALDGLYPDGPDELVDTLWIHRLSR